MTHGDKNMLLGLGSAAAIFSVVIFSILFLIAKFPPKWWLQQHEISRQIKAQNEPIATIVLDKYKIGRIYIPASVEVSTGGEGVVLTGPKETINQLYREAHGLDDEAILFNWRTE